jgi:hypothetical protein
VPFQVDTIAHEAGDNVVMREYLPGSAHGCSGWGGGRGIKLSAYVIGDDYDEQRRCGRCCLAKGC